MKLVKELLDYTRYWQRPDIYLFTGNSTIKNNGAIVMGRGAARQIRDTYPGIDKKFGNLVKEYSNTNLQFACLAPGQWLAWFKVKEHWADPAQLELIKQSTEELKTLAELKLNFRYHMNYPGIGNGGLTIEQVEPIVAMLPDNVTLYQKRNEK